MRSLLLASILLTAGVASAQSCGTLAITGSGAPGTTLDVSLTGSTADSYAWVFVGPNTGSTSIGVGPLFSLTLDLDPPFFPVFLGMTDGSGDASRQITVPGGIPQQINLNAQAATFTLARMPFGISVCTSNTVAFTIG